MKSQPVLILEPDPALRNHLASLLRQWGYIPLPVGSIHQALDAVSRTRFSLSLVEMDLNGADAIELLRRLKLRGENSGPIIVLSDPLDLDRIAQANSLGIDDFLQKPFSPEEAASIGRWMDGGVKLLMALDPEAGLDEKEILTPFAPT